MPNAQILIFTMNSNTQSWHRCKNIKFSNTQFVQTT